MFGHFIESFENNNEIILRFHNAIDHWLGSMFDFNNNSKDPAYLIIEIESKQYELNGD